MLNIAQLQTSGAEASKNGLYKGILDEVQKYNGTPPADKPGLIKQLMNVCQIAGWYVTSKPPSGKDKNRSRWDAVTKLLTEAYAEADRIGVRLLTGPADFRKIGKNQSYWLEFLDPQHRPGFQLSPMYSFWLADQDAIDNKKSFWDCIGTVLNPDKVDILVKYYPQKENYFKEKHMLHFDGGRIKDHWDDNYTTSDKETHFSGNGWAIFVVSPEGEFFSGSHAVGRHHHSSFLGGGAIMAAGELVVDDGVIRIITAKSGHYRPSAANMLTLVNRFPEIPGDAIIQADLAGPGTKFHTVADFRAKGAAATVISRTEILKNLPLFAASRSDPGGHTGFYGVWQKAPV